MAFNLERLIATMSFEMQVVSHPPLTGEQDPERVAKLLFSLIGYTARKGPDHGISFKLFYDCFLLHPTKEWTVEELAAACGTTMPSIYRHLNKLKDYDIVEDLFIERDGEEGERRRAFRLRYGNLGKAWNFAEAHFQLAIENYRKSVDHLESLLEQARGAAPKLREPLSDVSASPAQ
jgi:DNA-binding transcriptional ArsR family regulator